LARNRFPSTQNLVFSQKIAPFTAS